jgi:4-hydroxy-3-methylbut-2-enyl diphosphate reductase
MLTEVRVAAGAGMCAGVKRAVDLALQAAASQSHSHSRVIVLGQLAHNPVLSAWLKARGIDEGEPAAAGAGDIAIIPSHGKGPLVYRQLEEQGCTVVDATCPLVAQAREKACRAREEGYGVIILGDPAHAEAAAYCQWLEGDCRVIADPEAALEALPARPAVLVQTTEDPRRLERLLERLAAGGIRPCVLNGLCPVAGQRREAGVRLAARADAMLVVGGKNSANTKNLAKFCQEIQPKTYLIETKRDIDLKWLEGIKLLGITAGASTPEWIIKEVVEMTDEFKDQDQILEQDAQHLETEQEQEQEAEANFSEMEAEMGCREFHPGDVVKGTVVKVSSDEVLVDIGYKSEGIIPAFELAFTKVDPQTVARVGDEITAVVMKEDRDGNILLSRKNALFEERIKSLEEAFEKGETVTATVIDVVKGGMLVDVGMRGFVPASHVERGFVKDLSDYLHKTLEFKILELNRGGRKVILSRKALLEESYQKVKEEFWQNIEEGQTKRGVVKRLTDFGAFVDIGGCDGLLHVSEMGWGKVAKPADAVSINDEIEVYVLKADRDKEKVSLSLKKLIPNPWETAADKYRPGEIYFGRVMRSASFGAFIQLEPGLEGLAHISQLARFRVNKVEDVLVEGMEIPVKVLDIDLAKKRISLSVKEAIDLPKLVKEESGREETAAKADEAAALAGGAEALRDEAEALAGEAAALRDKAEALADEAEALEDEAEALEDEAEALADEDEAEALADEDEAEALEDKAEALEDEAEALEDEAEALEDEAEALEDEAEALEDEAEALEDAAEALEDKP